MNGADYTLYGDILFIKGTNEPEDVKQNIKIMPSVFREVKAHRGAHEQAKHLNEVINWEEIKEIWGHSLGGAVALILGLYVDLPVKTFGAFRPFPFWVNLGEHQPTTNYIYGFDIVPRIFFWRKFYGDVVRIKGKGFHPFTDHLRYQQLKKLGVGGMRDD